MKRVYYVVIVLGLLLIGLFTSAQTTFAALEWCEDDLGPMAVIAEQQNAPAAIAAEQLVVQVPTNAVSTSKGGSNTYK